MTGTCATADHITVAIEDIDTQVAALNAQIDQMRTRVDTLVDVRVQLVNARAAVTEAAIVPLDDPPSPAVADRQEAAAVEERLTVPAPAAAAPKRTTSKRARRNSPASTPKHDLAEVARVALEAHNAGQSMQKAVFEQVASCPSAAMGGYLIKQARDAGHPIPARARTPKSPSTTPTAPAASPRSPSSAQVRGKVFQCDDCDDSFTDVADIIRHVFAAHNRRSATRAERTPTDPTEVAAA